MGSHYFTDIDPDNKVKGGEDMNINVVLRNGAKMPTKGHPDDAGFDLYAREAFRVMPGEMYRYDSGVCVEIPSGYVGFVMSKSGLNINHRIHCRGVVDAGYTGSIVVGLENDSEVPVSFEAQEKVAQLVILPIPGVSLVQVDQLGEHARGDSGFGSTGRF